MNMNDSTRSEKLSTQRGSAWAACASLIALTALAVCGAGCGQFSVNGGTPGTPGSPSPAAVVNFCASASGCTASTSFAVGTLRDLNLSIEWHNLSAGTHAQAISFFLPNGDLYRTYETAFEVPDGATSASSSQALPVAGTPIAQRNMTGKWQVTVALDGRTVSTQSVSLTP
jgi:hypothetical protein